MIIAIIIIAIAGMLVGNAFTATDAPNSPVVNVAPKSAQEIEDDIWCDAYDKAEAEFTALFNSYEVKRAKNGAMMIRQGNSGSFKFAKKGK